MMVNYYLDVETSGLNTNVDEILTIQFQTLDRETKEPIGELTILKAWESSEKEILAEFKQVFGLETWGFVAHGYNLKFENDFLRERCIANGLKPIELFSRPTVDLHPIGIMMNGGQFKGSGLDKMSGKEGNGTAVLEYYKTKDYQAIEDYIKQEAISYIELLVFLCNKMPEVLVEFRNHNGNLAK